MHPVGYWSGMILGMNQETSNLITALGVVLVSGVGFLVVFKSYRKLWVRCLATLLFLSIAGRMFTRYHAIAYGSIISASFFDKGKFANAAKLQAWMASGDLATHERLATAIPVTGGRYRERISDLKEGLTYYSAQESLSPAERYHSPPRLHLLHLNLSNPSDKGVIDATAQLIIEYTSGL